VDFSKFKIELYDLFGLLIPGLILQTDCMIAIGGWHGYIAIIGGLSGNLIAASLALAYVLGHLVQEAGDISVRLVTRDRYLKTARDKFWNEEDGKTVRESIKKEIGHDIESVDLAYDYSLSRVKGAFTKRDAFIATSDLARSLVFLTLTTALAIVIALWRADVRGWELVMACALTFSLSFLVEIVSWRRMMRFREFADKPVFAAYLASLKESGEKKDTSSATAEV